MFLANSIVVISYTKKYPKVNIQQGISIFNIKQLSVGKSTPFSHHKLQDCSIH